MVNAAWNGPQSNIPRSMVAVSQYATNYTYNTTLQISPLNTSDTGYYQCTGNLFSYNNYTLPSDFVSGNISLMVQGGCDQMYAITS